MQNPGPRQRTSRHDATLWQRTLSGLMAVILTAQMAFSPVSALGTTSGTLDLSGLLGTGDVQTVQVDGAADGQTPSSDAAADEDEKTVDATPFTTVWDDNEDAAAARPAIDSEQLTYQLQYREKDSDAEWAIFDAQDSDLLAALGLDEEQAAELVASVAIEAVEQTYVASAQGLPAAMTDAEGNETQLEWQVVRTGDIEGYEKVEVEDSGDAEKDATTDETETTEKDAATDETEATDEVTTADEITTTDPDTHSETLRLIVEDELTPITDDSQDEQPADFDDEAAAQDDSNDEKTPVADETTRTATELNGSAEFTTVWVDNGATDRPDLTYQLQFRLKDASDWTVFDATNGDIQNTLGITVDQASAIAVSVSDSGPNRVASATGLPSKVEEKTSDSSSTQEYEWQIVRAGDVAGYQKLAKGAYDGSFDDEYYGADSNIECLQLLKDVTFTVALRDGTGALASSYTADSWNASFGQAETLTTLKEGSSVATSAGILSNSVISVNGNAATIVAQAPVYYPDGTALDYTLSHSTEKGMKKASDGTYDYYQVSYDNSNAHTTGRGTLAAYDGGTVILTHAGTTRFSADLTWKDEGNTDKRGDTKFSLYRYSINGGSTSTAAHVANSAGEFISFTVSAADNRAAGDGSIDLGDRLTYVQGALAKYDPDGYPYVYFLREESIDGYLRVAGSVSEDENGVAQAAYDKANYYTAALDDDSWGSKETGVTASDSDVAIYNNGTITNVRQAKVSPQLTKSWDAGSYQDQLSDVTVKMELKRHVLTDDMQKGEQAGLYAVDDTWDTVGTVTLSGWASGNMSQTAYLSQSQEKYDLLGRAYIYQWCEVDVYQPEGGQQFNAYTEGELAGVTGVATLKLKDETGASEVVTFEGSYANGTITNTHSGTTTARVTKYWNVSGTYVSGEKIPYGVEPGQTFTFKDADGNDIETTFPASLTFSIYQDETLYAAGLAMDGTVDDEWTTVAAADGTQIKYREVAPWQIDFDGLPKYDASGSKYRYQTVEKTPGGFSSSSAFKVSTDATDGNKSDGTSDNKVVNFSAVYNSPYSGEGTMVRLSKTWEDDGNNTGRNAVKVEVYAKTDVVKKDGTLVCSKDDVITSAELSDANGWYAEAHISAGGGIYLADDASVPDGFTPGNGNGFYYGVREASNDNYDVISKSDAQEADSPYADVFLSPWEDGVQRMVTKRSSNDVAAAGGYAYDISYSVEQDLLGSKVVVTNRRVGLINMQLTKKWVDGDSADTTKRPDAYYVVTGEKDVNDQAQKIFSATDGYVYVTLPGSSTSYPLYTDATHATQLKVSDLANESDFADGAAASTLRIKIATVESGNSVSTAIYGLPKYDDAGAPFSYSASEDVTPTGDQSTEYTRRAVNANEQFDSNLQHGDMRSYTFTNIRGGTKDVTFCLRWHDHYVKDTLNQRPDVYLTLYKLDENNQLQVVTGYENGKWVGLSDWNGNSTDANYSQSATIHNLPKYDSNGKEIVYYAVATPSVNQKTLNELDYNNIVLGPVDNPYEYNTSAWSAPSSEVQAADKTTTITSQSGETSAIREGGTFIFGISDTLSIQGTKTWANIPSDYTGALPDFTIFLQQRLASSNTEWSSLGLTSWNESGTDYINNKYYVFSNVAEGGSHNAKPDGKSAVAWMTVTGNSASNKTTTFNFTRYGDNGSTGMGSTLDKYDSEGRIYEYRALEVMDGLLKDASGNPAGGFTLDELIENIGTDGNNCYSGPTITSSGLGSSTRVTNSFKTTQQEGKITVWKTFSGRADGDRFPATTFTLYRRVDTGEENAKWTKVDTKALDTSNFDTNGRGKLDFTELAIYAPNGKYYEYKVEESSINGYETYAVKGAEVSEGDTQQLYVEGLHAGAADNTASFLNVYTPSTLGVSGTKIWKDTSNQWDTRADIFDTLVLTRTYQDGGGTEYVTLRMGDPNAEGYFTWTSDFSGSGAYTQFSIANLEKWAPDGQLWVYSLKEDDSKVTSGSSLSQYALQTSAAKVTSGYNPTVILTNTLKSSVKVTKTFVGDSSDTAYQQRPRVYLALQVSTDNGASWQAAKDVLGVEKVNNKGFEQYWSPKYNGNTSMSYTWDQLPATVNGTAVIYRAIESKLEYGSQTVTTSVDAAENYAHVDGPYAPSQSTSRAGDVTTTTITNKLNSTYEFYISKKWDDDSNKWGLRQTVTYVLQRSTDYGASWQWVTKYNASVDSPFTSDGTALNDSLVKVTIGESDADGDEGELANNWSKTLKDLPAVDANDSAYTYRAVEVVPTGYSVTSADAAEVASNDSFKLYAVKSGDVSFQNTLDTVTIAGTKEWKKLGLDLPDPSNVQLVVQQYKGQNDANPVTIEASKASVVWTDTTGDSWTYKIEGLPKTASDGTTYYYKVTETAGTVDGFYPTNPSGLAQAGADGNMTNGTITNTATKLALDKVGAVGSQSVQLNDVEFTIKNASGDVVAVWGRDAQGTVSVTSTNGCSSMTDATTGVTYIVGLAAGAYTVSETKTPTNYVAAKSFTVTIAANGVVSTNANYAPATDADSDGVAETVTVTDDVLRGNFQITKTASDSGAVVTRGAANGNTSTPVEGMTFDLYKDDGTLLAKNLTTDKNGAFASKSSSITYEVDANLGENYTKLSDGLPVGEYYLIETGEKADLVTPSGEDAKTTFSIAANSDAAKQPDTVNVAVSNTKFSATVTLSKTDATSGDAISGAAFKLEYKAPGAGDYATLGSNYTTNDQGVLTLPGLMKGSYTLTETANTGYSVPEGGIKVADFVIDNNDAGGTFDLGNASDRTDIEASNVNAIILADGSAGMTNERLTGSVKMTKADESGNALSGAVFKLQVMSGDDWADVEGKTSLTTGTDGTITVDGLSWATYRFVEVTPAAGHYNQTGTDPVTTKEVTISRNTVATTQDCGSVTNKAVALTLKKTNVDGTVALGGAVFKIAGTFADGVSEKAVTSGDDGSATLSGQLIVGNVYEISETTAPAGYKLSAEKLAVKVNADGTLEVQGEKPSAFTVKDSTVTMADDPTTLRVVKTNQAGRTLTGAEFELSGDFVTAASPVKLTVNEIGSVELDKGELRADGTTVYTLKETKAPAGYKCSDAELRFTVATDGSIAVNGEKPAEFAVDAANAAVTMKDEQTTFSLTKSAEGYDASRMGGAVFQLSGTFASATSPVTLTIGQDGTADTSALAGQLVVGQTYTLTETKAPAGFKLDAGTARFTVAANGTLTAADGSSTSYSFDGASVSVTDRPVVLTITKLADDNATKLAGAVFAVTPADGSAFADGTTVAKSLTTGDDGTSTLTDQLVVGDTYTIEETQAPAGYKKLDATLTVKVANDGSLEVQGEASGAFKTSGETVKVFTGSVNNDPTTFVVVKTNQADQTLTGAEFELSGEFVSAASPVKLTVNEIGSATLDKAQLKADGQTVYILKETKAPVGYRLSSAELQFTVATDGSVSVSGEKPVEFTVGSANATVTMADEVITLELVKTDAADAAKALAGATYKFTPVEGSEFQGGAEFHEYTTDENGKLAVPSGVLLAGNTYYVEETAAASGYTVASGKLAFKVNANGTVAKVEEGSTTTAISVTADGAGLVAADAKTQMTLVKTGENGAKLEGATFKVAGDFVDGETEKAVTTGDDGSATLSGQLIVGNVYEISETAAPAGYKLSAEKLAVKVNADGTLEVQGEKPSAFTVKESTVTMADDPTTLTVVKTNQAGRTLTGAEFELSGDFVTAASPVKLTVNEIGEATLANAQLKADGTTVCTLKETKAPAGYKCSDAELKFTVATDGSVNVSGEKPAEFAVDAVNAAVTMADEQTTFSLTKTAEGYDASRMGGAEFELKGTFAGDSAESTKTLTAGDNGAIDTSSLTGKLIVGNTYTLTETKAPAGFKLSSAQLIVKMKTDGTLEVQGETPAEFTVDGSAVAMTDEPTTLTIVKTNQAGQTLTGAEFELSGDFVTAASPVKLTVNEIGSVELDKGELRADGTTVYALKETKSPAGYKCSDAELKFTVATDGSVNVSGDVPAAFTVDAANASVTMADEQTTFSLTKSAEGYDASRMAGAVFQLSGTFASATSPVTLTIGQDGTADTSALAGQLVVGQTYTLTETKAPAGFKLDAGTARFTVAANGTLTAADGSSTSYSFDGASVSVTDRPVVLTITKLADDNATKLAGAVFAVTPADGSAFADGTTVAKSLTTGDDGTSTLTDQLVVGDTYTIEETQAPAGYKKLDATLNVKVADNGALEVQGDDPSSAFATFGEDVKVFTGEVTDDPTTFSVTKTDKDGAVLTGAEFELSGEFVSAKSPVTLAVRDNGVAVLDKAQLKADGTTAYTLKETKAPAGYKCSDAELKFTVATDGSIVVSGEKPDEFTADGANAAVTMADEQTTFSLTKSAEGYDASRMAGAVFQLSGTFASATSPVTLTIGQDGTADTSALAGQLVVGEKYTLTETVAPAGFKLAAGTATFTVAADGTLTAEAGSSTSYSFNGASVEVTDEATSLVVTKTSEEGSTKLSGAEFSVTPAEGSSFADGETEAKALITGADGTAALTAAQLIVGDTYTLAETKAPAGYKLLTQNVTFTVAADGSLEVQGTAPAAFTVDGASVTVTDAPTTFSVTKVDENGDPLAGATFTLTGDFADGSTAQTLTTADTTGAAAVAPALLKADGTTVYTLKEVEAPENYMLNLDELQFTVGVDGIFTAVGTAPSGYQIATNGVSVVLTDARIAPVSATVSVNKVVEGGTDLVAGQTFSFELRDATTGLTLKTLDGVKANDTGSFAALTYTKPGVYKYAVYEKNDGLGYGWTLPDDVAVEVTVGQNADKSLQAPVVKYGADASATSALFTNRYTQASGSFRLALKKTVNGKAPKAGQTFEFCAAATGENAATAPVLANVTTAADGTATFSAAPLDDSNVGKTYTYTIHEVTQLASGWTAADDVTATVAVGTRGADGKLPVSVTYDGVEAAAATFDNGYEASAEPVITVYKTANGGSYETDKEFEFGLYETDESGAKKGEPVSTVKVKAGQTATFEGIGYDQDDDGETITYVVSEIGDGGAGWTNAADATVSVHVTDNGDGTMSCAVDYGARKAADKDAALFDNKYACEGELALNVTKTVNGGSYATDREFELGLFETDESGEKTGEPVSTVKVRAGQTATLKGVFYDLDNAGETIGYVVSEISEPGAGWTNAPDQAVAVKVTDNGDGAMTVAPDYGEGKAALTFDNTYSCEGELELSVTKTVNGGAYETDREFEFGLFETDESGEKTGEPVSTVKVRAGQTATLKGVFYDLDNAGDTITYVVSEISEPGAGWTNAADQKVAVKVTDDLDGTMTVAPDYGEGKTSLVFDNTYKPTVNPDDPEGSDGPVAPDGSEAQKPAGTPQTGDASASALYTLATAGLFLVAASIARRRDQA